MINKRKQAHPNLVLCSLFLGYMMVYIDKLSVGISIVSIDKDYPMSEGTKGLILSAFFIGYALMQIPMSFLINRFGARLVILSSLVLIGVFDFLFGRSSSVEMLIAMRLLTGMLAHSGYASAASKEVTDSFPIEKRTFVKGILISSSGVAGVLGPILLSPIIEINGWRAGYTLLTIVSLTIAVIVAFTIPKNRTTNQRKLAASAVPIRTIWKMPMIWSLFFAAFFANNLVYGLNNWLPSYLTSVRALSLTQSGFIASFIGLLSLIGALGGSYIASHFFANKDKEIIMVSSFIAGILVFISYFLSNIYLFTLLLGIASLFLTTTFVVLMAIPMKRFEGALFAPSYSTIATGGIIGGAVAQLVIGLLVETTGSYLTVFLYFLSLGILTCLSMLFVKQNHQ